MTNIEQLIQTLCPNGVPWKTLVEVATLSRGKVYSKEYLRDNAGEYPVYSSQTANNGELGKISTYDYDGKYLTWTTDGAYAGTVFRREGKFSITNVCGLISNVDKALSIDFLYYWLNKVAKDYVYQGMGNPKLMSNVMETIPIPLPPLEIQNRIVEILDRFSALAAELQAELQLRRKQYEYYRTRLLTPHSESDSTDNTDVATSSSWQWKTLGEIGIFQRGNGLQKKDFTEEGVGCIHYGQIYTRLGTFCNETITRVPKELAEKLVKVYKGNLVIACTSENVEDCCKAVAWLGDETIVTGGHSAVFRHNENPKYIAYAFQSEIFQKQKNKFAKGVKVIDIKIEELAKIKIPLPSFSEQQRIVAILDKFDKLTTSLSDGIPAEQQAQQKRYEYYRDLLLNFNNNAPKVPNAPRDPKDPKDPKATKI